MRLLAQATSGSSAWKCKSIMPHRPGLSSSSIASASSADDAVDELPPEWERRHLCAECQVTFSRLGKWRHHCRCCGRSLCNAHSNEYQAVPQYGYYRPVRCCGACSALMQQVFRVTDERLTDLEGSIEAFDRSRGRERVHLRQTSDGNAHITFAGRYYGRSKPFEVRFVNAGPIGMTFVEVGACMMKVVDTKGLAAQKGVRAGDHILSINGQVLATTPRLCTQEHVRDVICSHPRPLVITFVRPRLKGNTAAGIQEE